MKKTDRCANIKPLWQMKWKEEHLHTVVTLEGLKIERNIFHHLFGVLKRVSGIKHTV